MSLAGMVRSALAEIDSKGEFQRTCSTYRNIISSEHSIFTPSPGRYHLYISLACPWANRCLAVLNIKGLESSIGVTIVHPTWNRTRPNDENDVHCGWQFHDSASHLPVSSSTGYGSFIVDKCSLDSINHATCIRDLYEISGDSSGKFTVPVLWDTVTNRIVNNESSEIIRMLNSAFNDYSRYPDIDLYPPEFRQEIDRINALVYDSINNGVYKCGFAKSQESYDAAVSSLFKALEEVEQILSRSRYIISGSVNFTEADIRLFMTLVRFDEVYVVYFKTNMKRISDFTNMLNYCRELYQNDSIGTSIDMNHIKIHYFSSHPQLNPFAIIPVGSGFIDQLKIPHDRSREF